MILFCLDCLATGRADIDKHYRSELLYLQVVIGSFEREMVVFAFEALLFEGRGERRNVVKRLDHRPGRRIFESIGTESLPQPWCTD